MSWLWRSKIDLRLVFGSRGFFSWGAVSRVVVGYQGGYGCRLGRSHRYGG